MATPRDDSPDRLLNAVEDAPSDTPSESDVDDNDYVEATPSDGYSASDYEDAAETEPEVEEGGSNIPAREVDGFSSIAGGNPGSVLGQFQNWRFQQPMAAPLGFQVPSDGIGGVETRTLVGHVDFGSRKSVSDANNYTRQRKERARIRYGLPPLRPNLRDRTIDATQDAWIRNEYRTYAAANGNRQIPNPELTRRFNARFNENPPRTNLSMSGYVNRKLKDVKDSYVGRQRRRR